MAALWGHHLEGEKWDRSIGKGVEGALCVEGMSPGSRKSGSEPPRTAAFRALYLQGPICLTSGDSRL